MTQYPSKSSKVRQTKKLANKWQHFAEESYAVARALLDQGHIAAANEWQDIAAMDGQSARYHLGMLLGCYQLSSANPDGLHHMDNYDWESQS